MTETKVRHSLKTFTHTTTNIDEVAYLVCQGFTVRKAVKTTYTTKFGVKKPTASFTLEGPLSAGEVLGWKDKRDLRSRVFPRDLIDYRLDAKRVIHRIIKEGERYVQLS